MDRAVILGYRAKMSRGSGRDHLSSMRILMFGQHVSKRVDRLSSMFPKRSLLTKRPIHFVLVSDWEHGHVG